jgi:hypothetical protein
MPAAAPTPVLPSVGAAPGIAQASRWLRRAWRAACVRVMATPGRAPWRTV